MNEALQQYEGALSVTDLRQQVNLIQHVMQEVMKNGEHYGTIPGCGDKPTLLKPGAEKLSMTFRMAPIYEVMKSELVGEHREYQVICSLSHINTGLVLGQGLGVCTTMETKYRFRRAARKCPACGQEAIIKGREEYGGGWLCFKAKGGCGQKWDVGAAVIEAQEVGTVEYENPADYYNTVLKMAKKRAHIDAVLTATAASDIFTQDIEDIKIEPEPVAEVVEVKTDNKIQTEKEKEELAKPISPSDQDDIPIGKPPAAIITQAQATAFRKEVAMQRLTPLEAKAMLKEQGVSAIDKIPADRYDELFKILSFMAEEKKERA